ncbi:MAG: hypothetical protein Q4G43_13535 [Mobilicoccus sp.]|nr:hypothetical protein [Mobilicoccus sp.]
MTVDLHAARTLPDALTPVLRRQRGLVSRAQLRDAGLSREAVRWGLTRRWTVVLPGVVHIGGGGLTDEQRATAALLFAGEDCALAGPTAVLRYGIEAPAVIVHVLAPPTASARQVRWVRVHRSTVPDTAVRVIGGLRTCSVHRAVLDAARWARSDADAIAMVIAACQQGLASTSGLVAQLSLFGRAPGTARAARAIAAAEAGSWSLPEFVLATAVGRSRRLPDPWLNPTLATEDGHRLLTPDLWFDDVALAVMVHSKRHHARGADWTRTVEADGDLVAHGVHVLGIAPASIFTDVGAAVAKIEAAYRAARSGTRPAHVRATPR